LKYTTEIVLLCEEKMEYCDGRQQCGGEEMSHINDSIMIYKKIFDTDVLIIPPPTYLIV